MELLAQTSKPPLLILFVLNGSKIKFDIKWGEKTALVVKSQQNFSLSSESAIVKFIALNKGLNWLGNDADEEAEVGHWVRFSHGQLSCASDYADAVAYLDKKIQPVTYFVGNRLTLADLAVFSVLVKSKDWNNSEKPTNLMRWFKMISDLDFVRSTIESLPDCVKLIKKEGRKEEGKFVDLPDAEMGKVIVRFPPEASGYLHIGHAKAALLNQYYKEAFDGKLIMRFDDTNPAKEKVDFEKVILEDLKLLKIPYDIFSHTSDHFDYILTLCEKLLKEGKAYVDDTEPEQMKNEREQKVKSKNRSNSVDKNFNMWKEMLNGTEYGQKCCVRAKIDMSSLNGCMRDPTIYRCKNEPHPKTGTKYKVYPTYDFACPIVDSIEGVTHCLRTMEYHDRDEQFFWFIDALGLRKPHIWEYSRLNMVNTVLSKRKLTWFVDNKYVDGWDDPRMPTVRGILRRGMTVEGLKQFIISQGSSRSVVVMEWDKIWAINKKVIDPIAPRYTAVSKDNVVVNIKGVKEEPLTVPKHPKNPEVGNKTVWVAPQVLIDQADADLLKEGENVTFINWGNILINKIVRQNGKVVSVEASPNLEDKNYKKTMKITFLAKTDKAPLIPCYCLYFDHIISKPILGKDEDFKDYINKNTLSVVESFVDPELASLKQFDIIQIQRKGFFICDRVYQPLSENIGQETPLALIFIPDGHTKEMPTSVVPSKSAEKEKKVNSNDVASIASSIQLQGDLVRDLKAKKAGKDQIKTEVDKLLALKAEYKKLTGNDYQPGAVPATNAANKPGDVDEITKKIILQGDLVRDLKAKKAGKDEIKAEVDKLLALKGDYKKLTGKDYQPGAAPSTPSVSNNQGGADEVAKKIQVQGDLVRDLKAKKAGKDEIKTEVDKLLSLKAEYKKLTGKDYQPGAAPATPSIPVTNNQGQADEVAKKIQVQGDLVRDLKAKKAGKDEIKTEVDKLLALKAEYKKLTGNDFQPAAPPAKPANKTDDNKVVEITERVKQQGDIVRDLKAKKASKDEIKVEVDKLLALKAEYKQLTGNDFPAQPPQKADKQSTPPAKANEVGDNKVTEITNKVKQQGDLVRDLKAKKASKEEIKNEVDKLLALKAEYKQLTGNDFPAQPAPVKVESNEVLNLTNDVKKQGDIVRDLKAKKAGKDEIDAAVKLLLELKSKYKELTGNDFPAEGRQKKQESKPKAEKYEGKAAKQEKPKDKKQNDDSALKKVTRLGLEAEKEVDLPEWYSQVLTKGELIEYYDVSGCYILRPWSFAIWENIKDWFDAEIKKMGVKNCYFPIFVSRSVLEKEKTHIADFAPEVAWVTKSGDSDLAEPIAVRPTSETVMYPAYAKWIQSYRDLPIKLNQWNNVVRWEFKHPQPFLRTREFLWQEGHTAFASAQEAEEEVTKILDLYAQIYTDLLAIPVVKGRKTEKEKFAGGDFTLTAEAFISASGRAIQGATSHHLGQNFSKMFEIIYEDPVTHEKKFVYQNSWGITTRTIGVMIMVHADNQGLVLPPRVASMQIVIVPCGITAGLAESEIEKLHQSCEKLKNDLVAVGVRAETDLRSNYSPGWKYNHWELKGVPIRVEIGPKDLQKGEIVAVRRDNGAKTSIKSSAAVSSLKSLLDTIQSDLLKKATEELNNHMFLSRDWKSFCQLLDEKNIIQAPFCGEIDCEDNIKNDSARNEDVDSNAPSMGAKSLCIPFTPLAQNNPSDKCIHPKCNRKSKYITLFGRSY